MIGKPRAAPGGAETRDLAVEAPRRQWRAEPAAPAGDAARPGVARTVVAVVGFSLLVVAGAAALAGSAPPVWRWVETLYPRTEISGPITSIAVESGSRRGGFRRWRGPGERLVLRVAPYSFGLYFPCDDTEHCAALRAKVARGDTVTASVDKEAFEELLPANRTVDHKNPSISRRGEQIVAAAFDPRRVRLYRLDRNGETLLAD